MVVGLEQRYYGNSKPFPNLETHNMKYLTLEQSVKDIGRFVKRVDLKDLVKGEKPRWVVVGGSYGGNLAAWSRLKFPDLIYAGWISSAPLQAAQDFPEYDTWVGHSLDAQCQKDLVQAINQLDANLLLQGGKRYKSEFECDDVENDDVAWGIAEALGYLAQYSIPQRPPEISEICSDIQGEDKLLGMSSFYKRFYSKFNFTCNDLSGHDEKMDTNPANDAAMVRQNFYIMCRETGHFQIAPNNGNHFRSHIITRENTHKRFCIEPFGITEPPNIDATNAMFGGLKINATRLAFTTGDLDPWFHLTLHDESLSTPERPIYVIQGGRHTSDFNSPRLSGQPPAVAEVRRKVFSHIKGWLALPT
ncbi:hypothetical protein DSO57_1009322 [Entomophthora muscae]|uniref:Uncharacterized protein n=1 Tax=Entomophthora muscae TaxID=34485 RepID=A0ACC2S8N4_9FUNG|nr:hypothetical protein DSO57_1009322 [Entomophthora muscae]